MKSLQHNNITQGTDQNLIQQNIQEFGSNQERLAMLRNSNEITHTVVSGDSYWAIAQQHSVSVETVQSANDWKEMIHPGEVITFSTTDVIPQREEQPQEETSEEYNPTVGRELAAASLAETAGRIKSTGMCYFYVANAVDKTIERFLYGGHAYMAADQLAAKKDLFVEVSATSLSSLPAGAIVVWGKGNSKSGHISIAQGDGTETSDFRGKQMLSHYGDGSARVFLPKGG
jgi:LysM repeat protein